MSKKTNSQYSVMQKAVFPEDERREILIASHLTLREAESIIDKQVEQSSYYKTDFYITEEVT